jgi:hypothetical protein
MATPARLRIASVDLRVITQNIKASDKRIFRAAETWYLNRHRRFVRSSPDLSGNRTCGFGGNFHSSGYRVCQELVKLRAGYSATRHISSLKTG